MVGLKYCSNLARRQDTAERLARSQSIFNTPRARSLLFLFHIISIKSWWNAI
jgi:hypothetical protein